MWSRGTLLLLAGLAWPIAEAVEADAAASRPPARPAPAAPAPPPPPPQVVPYDAALLRLAEIMGSLHFLQQLCDGEGSSAWRDQMAALLDAEQPDDQRRARLVDRFNRGFESYRSVYRGCTDSARMAITRYQEEGTTIATDIRARYGRGG
jgi:uncharacterized protein (TIGR02301 family)